MFARTSFPVLARWLCRTLLFVSLALAAPRAHSAQQDATSLEELRRQLQEQSARIQQLESNRQDLNTTDASDAVSPEITTQLEELTSRLSTLESSAGQLRRDLDDSFLESPSTESLRSTTGRLHLDYWGFPQDSDGIKILENGAVTPVNDKFELRRIRLGIRGQVPPKNVSYQLDLEFSGIDRIGVRDAWIGIDEHPLFDTIRIGNQKRPYGLDQLNSSNFTIFIERPMMVDAINDPNRRFGVQVFGASPDLGWNWRYGGFNMVAIEELGAISSNTYQTEMAGRLARTAWYHEPSNGRGYLHLGVSTSFRFPATNPSIATSRYNSRPEARSASQWLDTGAIGGVQASQLVGAESVLNLGSLQVGMEYMNVWLQRGAGTGTDLHLQGGHVYLSYFLTGEHIPWNRDMGILGRLEPRRNFIRSKTTACPGWGAWQLAMRASMADLNDSNVFGGYGRSATFALNWYWNAHTRWQINYIVGSIDDRQRLVGVPGSGLISGDYQIVGTRFMIDY